MTTSYRLVAYSALNRYLQYPADNNIKLYLQRESGALLIALGSESAFIYAPADRSSGVSRCIEFYDHEQIFILNTEYKISEIDRCLVADLSGSVDDELFGRCCFPIEVVSRTPDHYSVYTERSFVKKLTEILKKGLTRVTRFYYQRMPMETELCSELIAYCPGGWLSLSNSARSYLEEQVAADRVRRVIATNREYFYVRPSETKEISTSLVAASSNSIFTFVDQERHQLDDRYRYLVATIFNLHEGSSVIFRNWITNNCPFPVEIVTNGNNLQVTEIYTEPMFTYALAYILSKRLDIGLIYYSERAPAPLPLLSLVVGVHRPMGSPISTPSIGASTSYGDSKRAPKEPKWKDHREDRTKGAVSSNQAAGYDKADYQQGELDDVLLRTTKSDLCELGIKPLIGISVGVNCVWCFYLNAESIAQPCEHLTFCGGCLKKYQETPLREICPVCVFSGHKNYRCSFEKWDDAAPDCSCPIKENEGHDHHSEIEDDDYSDFHYCPEENEKD